MPGYNGYTKTNDFPIIHDFIINPQTGKYFDNYYDANNYIRRMRQGSFIQQRDLKDILRVANAKLTTAFFEWCKVYNIPQDVINKWLEETKKQLETSTPPDLNWWEKLVNKVTTTVDTFISNAGQVLTNAGESAALAPLLPFKKAMVNALRRQGENVSMSSKLFDVASLFKQKIIDRSSTTQYEHAEDEGVTFDKILQLVDKIIPFFSLILEKVRSGKATQEEKLINADAEEEAEKTTSGGAPTTTGVNSPEEDKDFFKKNKFLIIGVLAVVLFLAFRKK